MTCGKGHLWLILARHLVHQARNLVLQVVGRLNKRHCLVLIGVANHQAKVATFHIKFFLADDIKLNCLDSQLSGFLLSASLVLDPFELPVLETHLGGGSPQANLWYPSARAAVVLGHCLKRRASRSPHLANTSATTDFVALLKLYKRD